MRKLYNITCYDRLRFIISKLQIYGAQLTYLLFEFAHHYLYGLVIFEFLLKDCII